MSLSPLNHSWTRWLASVLTDENTVIFQIKSSPGSPIEPALDLPAGATRLRTVSSGLSVEPPPFESRFYYLAVFKQSLYDGPISACFSEELLHSRLFHGMHGRNTKEILVRGPCAREMLIPDKRKEFHCREFGLPVKRSPLTGLPRWKAGPKLLPAAVSGGPSSSAED